MTLRPWLDERALLPGMADSAPRRNAILALVYLLVAALVVALVLALVTP